MPIVKIEPTGCCVRKGKVQLRFSFYLEPTDPRYEEHHIQVPIIPLEGYLGEVDAEGSPINQADYDAWIESLPKEWQNNPFHNHFVYVDPDTTDKEIKQLMAETLDEFFGIWNKGQNITKVWRAEGRLVAGDLSADNLWNCQLKVEGVKIRALEFQVIKEI